jgi:hypothetical protein
MRLQRLKSQIHLGLCGLILLGGTVLHAQASVSCQDQLPPQAQKAVAAKLKHWKVVTTADLPADDREIWEDDYAENCPGITAGQFAPKQSPAFAVTLIRSIHGSLYQTLVLVAGQEQRYQVTTLSRSQKVAHPSIVRRLPSGSYSSAQGQMQIDAPFDVIGYETIQAGTIIYYWSNNKYKDIVISE